jgi:hypothetical protein
MFAETPKPTTSPAAAATAPKAAAASKTPEGSPHIAFRTIVESEIKEIPYHPMEQAQIFQLKWIGSLAAVGFIAYYVCSTVPTPPQKLSESYTT